MTCVKHYRNERMDFREKIRKKRIEEEKFKSTFGKVNIYIYICQAFQQFTHRNGRCFYEKEFFFIREFFLIFLLWKGQERRITLLL